MFIWFNSKLIKREKVKVDIVNHSLHYGSGVFEGIRCYDSEKGPVVFRLSDHIKRLFNSAKLLGIKINFSEQEIINAVIKTIKTNKLKECYIRPIVFYDSQIKLEPSNLKSNLAIITLPFPNFLGHNTVKTTISKFIRLHPQSVISEAKASGYYINSILATLDAKKRGYDEAILLDYKGFVAEGPGENIFIVKKNILYTPKLGSILPGITRKTVMELAKDLKIKVIEKDITLKELKSADEIFFTGTAAEITPISQIDKITINNGKIGKTTSLIKNNYSDIVRAKNKKYYKWLSFINFSNKIN